MHDVIVLFLAKTSPWWNPSLTTLSLLQFEFLRLNALQLQNACKASDLKCQLFLTHKVLAVAEIFSLMSRDEARHAGFLNKAMSDFNLALDLGFLTKNRKYTFFKPQYIFYATYLSEKVSFASAREL